MCDVLKHVGQTKIIRTASELDSLQPRDLFAIDIETSGCDKKPGFCPHTDKHGVMGIALGSPNGAAVYVVTVDSLKYSEGVPIRDAIEILNRKWFVAGKTAVLHNAKFDLGFLMARGLDVSKARIIDTWILRGIDARGCFTSNKLKDIMANEFGVKVATKDLIQDYLTENGTEDYGDVPVEKLASYACDDVRYTIALYDKFFEREVSPWMMSAHNLYLQNTFHLIQAEARGAVIDGKAFAEAFKTCQEEIVNHEQYIQRELGSADVEYTDEQAMLCYLHSRNLHPGPREQYGETKFVLDAEFLEGQWNQLTTSWLGYVRERRFMEEFSAGSQVSFGKWQEGEQKGIHVSHMLGVFSRGGAPSLRTPDLEKVEIKRVRKMFIPREGYDFVVVKLADIEVRVLAYYLNDDEIAEQTNNGGEHVCQMLYERSEYAVARNTVALALRSVLEGSGIRVFRDRLRYFRCKLTQKRNEYTLRDAFEAKVLPGLKDLRDRLCATMKERGFLQDRLGRVIQLPERENWKALSKLLRSSAGGIFSTYLDLLSRLSQAFGGHLVLAHYPEMVLEIPKEQIAKFYVGMSSVLISPLTEPAPVLNARRTSVWDQPLVDAPFATMHE
jgi:hypothetical protein